MDEFFYASDPTRGTLYVSDNYVTGPSMGEELFFEANIDSVPLDAHNMLPYLPGSACTTLTREQAVALHAFLTKWLER